ncbi:MAG: PAS domain S-box protein, partial [Pseudomonadota bacterium]|nr:PAS domain S-box protein [Pseudomonadota bacterium]
MAPAQRPAISETLVRLLVDNIPTLCWIANADGFIFWYNQRWHEYCGTTAEAMEGWGWQSVHEPTVLPLVLERWTACIRSGVPFEMTFPLKAADGTFRPFLTRVQPVKDDQQRVQWWVGINTDISAQHEAERALRSSESQLRQLNADLDRQVAERTRELGKRWEVSPDLLGVLNFEGYFEATNPAWQSTLGWSAQETQSARFSDFIHPDDLPRSNGALAATKDSLSALRFENRVRHKDGTWRWLSWVAVPEAGKMYCSARDVTAEKEAQVELAAAQAALRQAQKMEAVGQLTGGIAHDFNNLLAGISGALELLEKRIGEDRLGAIERYLSVAKEAARRAAALTQRLLAFARRQTLDPKPTDLNRLVGGMEELIRRSMGPDVRVEIVGAGGLWLTRIDLSQLENALLNLCINARDAMAPRGGRLTIETANKWLDQRAAQARELPPGQYVSLCVTDTGGGMPPEVVERAFDPFFTTKPLGQGTGLGLSMVYGFARQSGGQVRIYSEVGTGTTLCLYLPRYVGSALEAEPEEPTVASSGEGERVLVVDDEQAIRLLVVDV